VYQYGSRKPTAGVSKKSLTFSWAYFLASIGINDIVVRKQNGKWGGGGGFGDGGQG
jgi:hypothetical protein